MMFADRMRLEDVSKFKYFGCVFYELDTDEVECRRKVASGRLVAGGIRYLVNARGLQHFSCLFSCMVVR